MSTPFMYLIAVVALAASLGALTFHLGRPDLRADRALAGAQLEAYVDMDGEVRMGAGLPAELADAVAAARPG